MRSRALPSFAKSFLLTFFFAATAVGQNVWPKRPPTCGPWDFRFDAELDASPQAPIEPEPGKAIVYFIQDAGTLHTLGYPTTRMAIDGKWLGVNKKNSYFAVSVMPGERHLCAAEETRTPWEHVELTHFVAEAGKIYYFRLRRPLSPNGSTIFMEFRLADDDEAKYLISSFPISVSHPKK